MSSFDLDLNLLTFVIVGMSIRSCLRGRPLFLGAGLSMMVREVSSMSALEDNEDNGEESVDSALDRLLL